jgi:hypothetical protein
MGLSSNSCKKIIFAFKNYPFTHFGPFSFRISCLVLKFIFFTFQSLTLKKKRKLMENKKERKGNRLIKS